MKNEAPLWIILNSIFLVVFNLLFFVLGGADRNTSVWISYGFIHFAYFMLILTPKWIHTGKSAPVFAFSLYFIAAVYFFVQLVTGSIFIVVAPEDFKLAFVIQLCLAGVFGVMLVSHIIANERTADAEEKRQVEIAYIKEAAAKIKILLDGISDKEARKKVERIYDALHSSPVKSHPDLAPVEDRILQSVQALDNAVSSGNGDVIIALAGSLEAAINERNGRLKTYH